MKLNRKGFMLAEIIITSTVAITIIVSMYAVISNIINNYNERKNYYDIDTIYALGYVYNNIIEDESINQYISYSKSTPQEINKDSSTELSTIYEYYNINAVYIIYISNTSDIKAKIKDTDDTYRMLNKTLKKYLYSYAIEAAGNDKTIMVIERYIKDNNKYMYYYVEL